MEKQAHSVPKIHGLIPRKVSDLSIFWANHVCLGNKSYKVLLLIPIPRGLVSIIGIRIRKLAGQAEKQLTQSEELFLAEKPL